MGTDGGGYTTCHVWSCCPHRPSGPPGGVRNGDTGDICNNIPSSLRRAEAHDVGVAKLAKNPGDEHLLNAVTTHKCVLSVTIGTVTQLAAVVEHCVAFTCPDMSQAFMLGSVASKPC